MRSVVALVLCFAAVLAAATFGSTFMPGAWYAALAKPAWTPPNWAFAPVWSVLYLFIALAGWLVWRAEGFGTALKIWIFQLVLNAAWSWVMFGQHAIGAALGVIVALWFAIGAFITAAHRVSRNAALLFVPYWMWVSLATALNFQVWRLNP